MSELMSDLKSDLGGDDDGKLRGQLHPAPAPPTESQGSEVSDSVKQNEPKAASKKRPASMLQGKTTKKVKKVEELSHTAGERQEARRKNGWSDPEVIQLISLRSEMDADFEQNPHKQDYRIWGKLHARMITARPGSSKTSVACSKKWKAIYRQYIYDKRPLSLPREEQKITCKFFYDIERAFDNNLFWKRCHEENHGSFNPFLVDRNEEAEGQASRSGAESDPGEQDSLPTDTTPRSSKVPPARVTAKCSLHAWVKW